MSAAATAMSAQTAHLGIEGRSLPDGEAPDLFDLPDRMLRGLRDDAGLGDELFDGGGGGGNLLMGQ
jgi:hypothetical protein